MMLIVISLATLFVKKIFKFSKQATKKAWFGFNVTCIFEVANSDNVSVYYRCNTYIYISKNVFLYKPLEKQKKKNVLICVKRLMRSN